MGVDNEGIMVFHIGRNRNRNPECWQCGGGCSAGPTKLAQQNDKAHSMTRADPPTIRVTDSSSPAYTESQEPLLSEGGRRKRRERSVYGLGYETRQGASGPATGSRLNR